MQIYEIVPFERVGDVSFNFTQQDLIERGFILANWWTPLEDEPTEFVYENPEKNLFVRFSDKENKIINIHCDGVCSYCGILLNGISHEEVIRIFGEPNKIDTEFGAWFTDSDQELIYSYDEYGGVMIFLRYNKFHSISIIAFDFVDK